MTAKEVFEITSLPPEVLIVYKTEEWYKMMEDELLSFTTTRQINHHVSYRFVSESECYGLHADYVIAENGIPQYILMPLLKSHFFHDNKSPAKNPS